MNDLLRIQHGKPGHDLVLRRGSSAGYVLATIATDHGVEKVMHILHLKAAELAPLAKALIDVLAAPSA